MITFIFWESEQSFIDNEDYPSIITFDYVTKDDVGNLTLGSMLFRTVDGKISDSDKKRILSKMEEPNFYKWVKSYKVS